MEIPSNQDPLTPEQAAVYRDLLREGAWLERATIRLDELSPGDAVFVASDSGAATLFQVGAIDHRAIFGEVRVLELGRTEVQVTDRDPGLDTPVEGYLSWGSSLELGKPFKFWLETDVYKHPSLTLGMSAVTLLAIADRSDE